MFYEFSIFIGILKLPLVELVPIYTLTSTVWKWLSPHPHHYEVLAYFLLVGGGEKEETAVKDWATNPKYGEQLFSDFFPRAKSLQHLKETKCEDCKWSIMGKVFAK